MAARALVTQYSNIESTGLSSAYIMVQVIYFEDNVPGKGSAELYVPILWTDTLAQVKTKIVNEIISYGLGAYGFTIPAGSILMPAMTTGAL